MAKTKAKKNYTVEVADGKIRLTFNEPQRLPDGRMSSLGAVSPYPMYERRVDADGNARVVKLTRAQAIKSLLHSLGYEE